MTADVYAHLFDDELDGLADRMDAALVALGEPTGGTPSRPAEVVGL